MVSGKRSFIWPAIGCFGGYESKIYLKRAMLQFAMLSRYVNTELFVTDIEVQKEIIYSKTNIEQEVRDIQQLNILDLLLGFICNVEILNY